jgi:hypothetical protein
LFVLRSEGAFGFIRLLWSVIFMTGCRFIRLTPEFLCQIWTDSTYNILYNQIILIQALVDYSQFTRAFFMDKKKTYRKFTPGAGSGPATYNAETRSVTATIATGQPVEVYDFDEMRHIQEILLMSGGSWPENGQVPLCDCHQRSSTKNVLGSCRNIRVEGSELVADIHFSDDAAGQAVEKKYRDGHLTDLSVGAAILEYEDISDGEKATIKGKAYNGPYRVITRWKLFEVSAVPVGADAKSTVRSLKTMENENTNNQNVEDPAEQIRAERERVQEIMKICRIANLPKFAEKFISDGLPLDVVRDRLFKEMQRINPPIGVGRIAEDVTDYRGHDEAMIDGLVIRSGFKLEKPARGHEHFTRSSILDIARHFIKEHGREDTRMMGHDTIIRKAMTLRSHTTSDFPQILANVGNKILRTAYENTPATFQHWTVKGSAENFKQLSRVQLSEAPGLDEVAEKAEYTYGTFGESDEVFKVKKYGKLFKISWESLVNDDLGAFSRISKAFVQSAKRGLNSAVYRELTDNNLMSDGKAIFHTDHGNLANPGAAIAITPLSNARLAIRTQAGLQTDDPLNIEPKYLIVPAALETQADTLLNTMEGLEADEGPGQRNPFYRKLSLIPEPFLDTIDTAAWYIVADPRYFDTVEVAYLDGEEFPFIEEENGFITDSWTFKIRYCYGVKTLDWRGLYKNPGAGN